jgi:spore maturation protein CgeB
MKLLICDRKLDHSGWKTKEGEELRVAAEQLGHEVIIAGKGYPHSELSIVDISRNFDLCIITENYWNDWGWFKFSDVKIPKAFWAIDYHPVFGSNRLQEFIVNEKIDTVFTIDTELIPFNQRITGVKHCYLPYAVSQNFQEIKCEKDIDVSFIGSEYEQRKAMFPEYTKYVNGVFGDEYCKTISRSKINLNLSLTNGMNGKIFEIIGCKGFIITNYTHDTYDLFGDRIITYSSKEELKDKVKLFLQNERKRIAVANDLYELCIKNHSYQNRINELLSCMKFI